MAKQKTIPIILKIFLRFNKNLLKINKNILTFAILPDIVHRERKTAEGFRLGK